MSAGAPKKKRAFSLGQLVPIGFLAAFFGVFVWVWARTSEADDAAEQYVEHLRAGRTEAAYEMLCEPRRRALSLEAFADEMHTPELTSGGEPSWQRTEGPSSLGRACVVGRVETRAGSRGIHVYLFEEDDQPLCVHTVLLYDGIVPTGPWLCDGV